MPGSKAWAGETRSSDTMPIASRPMRALRRDGGLRFALVFSLLCTLFATLFGTDVAQAAGSFERYLDKASPAELLPGASAFEVTATGSGTGYARILKDGEPVGYAFLNTDFVNATGYSGKPIHVLVGVDEQGVITGTKLVKHHEPIVLIGIPEKRIIDFMSGYNGIDTIARAGQGRDTNEVDMISGATVTIMVIEDSILRSAIKFARQIGLGGLSPRDAQTPSEIRKINEAYNEIADWQALLGSGAVRHRVITLEEINKAFAESGHPKAAKRAEKGAPDELYIDLYTAPVSVPAIGRSLLGEAEYRNLTQDLEPGQQAIAVFANGRYSFKGSGYVRGGIFDRFQLVQGESSVRFRDKFHKRIGEIAAEGAPDFREIGLFRIPTDATFNPAEPYRIELLAHRAVGPIKKIFLAFDLDYSLPKPYVTIERPVAQAQPQTATSQAAMAENGEAENAQRVALWKRMWDIKRPEIVALALSIGILTVIFFFQDWLVQRPRLLEWTRNLFLVFTLLFVGFYAQAQLSVVNVLTFFNALLTDFSWNYFLMEPMIFILWFSVAGALLFWGRGAYCGWLCPFGALQELLNKAAKWFKVPQYELPWGLHERLWPIKYMIFLGLFALSLYSLQDAEHWAEVEPFKTAIILKFVRDWPWVLYAVALLAANLFVERFYCRYLCPLGAALAIPGRLRMFEWLKRHPNDCGTPCQTCAQECMVQAIHPTGEINPNECLYCLHCQMVYHDDHRCPPMVKARKKRERLEAMQSQSKTPKEVAAKGATEAKPCPAMEIPDFINTPGSDPSGPAGSAPGPNKKPEAAETPT